MHPIEELKEICQKLRDDERGCPWHLEQDIQSLAHHTLSESCELLDAIENKDMENLREELGDLLFHIALYSQHAEEQGAFTLEDVIK